MANLAKSVMNSWKIALPFLQKFRFKEERFKPFLIFVLCKDVEIHVTTLPFFIFETIKLAAILFRLNIPPPAEAIFANRH